MHLGINHLIAQLWDAPLLWDIPLVLMFAVLAIWGKVAQHQGERPSRSRWLSEGGSVAPQGAADGSPIARGWRGWNPWNMAHNAATLPTRADLAGDATGDAGEGGETSRESMLA